MALAYFLSEVGPMHSSLSIYREGETSRMRFLHRLVST